MYLSKLQLQGFKSFAPKTILKFNDGISCIIGPNGSGKSNIVDAVRWVLGEQRVSTLRSDKMENVIFNGAKDRKPMGMVEVSMTIQNNKKVIKTEYDEVHIARRLYRSGESQYLFNKTPVRLKDILDVFTDTGLGSNSYSVIELKMVETILSENKNERRELFEEAAGVVKYKTRRKSALRKLENTRTDLTRINDIISEVQHSVNSLSRQVGKARRYLNYTDELKKHELDISRFRYHRLMDDLRPLKQQLDEVSKLKDESHHQITIDEALLEDYKNEQLKTEQQLQEIQKKLNELDIKIADNKREEAVADTKADEMQKTKKRYKEEIEHFNKRIELSEEHRKQYSEELSQLTEQQEKLHQEFLAVDKKRSEEMTRLQAEKSKIDELNNAFRRQFEALASQKDQLKQKEYQQGFQQEQLSNLESNLTEQKAQIDELNKKKEDLIKVKRQKEAELNTIQNALNTLNREMEAFTAEKEKHEQERDRINAHLNRVQTRIQFFEQIINSYEGHAESTQHIMAHKRDIPGIHAPLSDIISVKPELTDLLEIVLGGALDYIIVDDIESAKSLIQFARIHQKGRVTAIPLQSIQNIPDPEPIKVPDKAKHIMDFITCKPQYKKLISILLGDLMLVDQLEEAINLSSKHPSLRYITAKGETVNVNHLVSGGSHEKREISIIGRKDQLEQLRKDEKNFQAQLQKVEKNRATVIKSLAKHEEEKQRRSQQLTEIRNALMETEKNEHEQRFQISNLHTQINQNENHLTALRKNLKQLKGEIEELQVKVESEQNELNELEQETIESTKDYEQKNDAVQALINEVQQAQLNVSNINNQLKNRQNDVERSKSTINDLKTDIDNRVQEIEQIEKSLVEIENNRKKRREMQKKYWRERDQLDDQLKTIEQEYQDMRDKIKEIEDQTKQYRRQHDSSLEKTRQLEMQISDNRYKAERIRENMLNEYAEDVEIGLPYEELDEEATEEQINLLKQRIKNLGAVNPLAVNEYDKEKERLDFLTKQRDDLLQ
ncbi:MAG: chromosome segregation protein SMC, partial [Caldithrix sp.]|nr:chromosome segregation protein SMC [Caldithrix sp.]